MIRGSICRTGIDNQNSKLRTRCKENPTLGHNQRYIKFLTNGLKATRSGLPSSYKKYYILQYNIEVKARISVEEDYIVSLEDSRNNKLSYNSEKNPKLGHNHRYV